MSIKDFKRKKQSVLVWKLLSFCLEKYFSIEKPTYSLSNDGVWSLEDKSFLFSLSHSENFVAVAISDNNIGVDVEKYDDKILKLRNKFDYQGDDKLVISLLTTEWTKRESLFKAKFGNNFFNKDLCDEDGNIYCLTVCTDYDFANFIPIDINELI